MKKAKQLMRYNSHGSGTSPLATSKAYYPNGTESAPPAQLYHRNSPKITPKVAYSVDTTCRGSLPDMSMPLSPPPPRPKTACIGDIEDLMKNVKVDIRVPEPQFKKTKSLSIMEQLAEDKSKAFRRMYLHGLKIDKDSYADRRVSNYLRQRGIGMEIIETGSPVIVNLFSAHKDRFKVNSVALSYDINEHDVRSFMEQTSQEDHVRCGLRY